MTFLIILMSLFETSSVWAQSVSAEKSEKFIRPQIQRALEEAPSGMVESSRIVLIKALDDDNEVRREPPTHWKYQIITELDICKVAVPTPRYRQAMQEMSDDFYRYNNYLRAVEADQKLAEQVREQREREQELKRIDQCKEDMRKERAQMLAVSGPIGMGGGYGGYDPCGNINDWDRTRAQQKTQGINSLDIYGGTPVGPGSQQGDGSSRETTNDGGTPIAYTESCISRSSEKNQQRARAEQQQEEFQMEPRLVPHSPPGGKR